MTLSLSLCVCTYLDCVIVKVKIATTTYELLSRSLYVCNYICIYVAMYVRVFVCICVYVYVYMQLCMCMYVYRNICNYVCVCMFTANHVLCTYSLSNGCARVHIAFLQILKSSLTSYVYVEKCTTFRVYSRNITSVYFKNISNFAYANIASNQN